MRPEADAEVTLSSGVDRPASPVTSYSFLISFGTESFSAAVIPNGSGSLKTEMPCRVRLQFLVAEVAPFLNSGVSFTFFEQGRVGRGFVL